MDLLSKLKTRNLGENSSVRRRGEETVSHQSYPTLTPGAFLTHTSLKGTPSRYHRFSTQTGLLDTLARPGVFNTCRSVLKNTSFLRSEGLLQTHVLKGHPHISHTDRYVKETSHVDTRCLSRTDLSIEHFHDNLPHKLAC